MDRTKKAGKEEAGRVRNNRNRKSNSNNRNGKKKKRRITTTIDDVVASRTRGKKKATALSLITILRPLLVECLTYLDPESIRQVCLLSKLFKGIIHNHPGMESNRVIPLLQIDFPEEAATSSGSSPFIN